MLKKTMLMVIVLALLVSTSNAGNGKDFNQSTALSICNDCAYEISSDVVGFGNVGLGYSESIHNVTFSSGADSVGTIELTFLVADPYAGAYGFDVEFTDYDTLIVDHESTAEGTWYNYQWVRNSLSVIDSTVNQIGRAHV